MKNYIKQAYHDWAPAYDSDLNLCMELEKSKVNRILRPKKGEFILDVGCGTGRYSFLADKAGAEVIGIDISKDMLSIAKKKVPCAKFIKGDITKNLPFSTKRFNKIICSLVLRHITDIGKLFGDLKRILKDDGFIIITTLHPKANFCKMKFKNMGFPLVSYNCTTTHSFSELKKEAKSNGLKIKIKKLNIGKSAKHCFASDSYKYAKGKPGTIIVILKKVL